MDVELIEIPGLSAHDQQACEIRALKIGKVSLALDALINWNDSEQADFGKIIKNMRLIGAMGRTIRNEKKLQRCESYPDIYEIRADKGKARLMCFFHQSDKLVCVCTNGFWKGSGNQNTAFKHADQSRTIYIDHLNAKAKKEKSAKR